ncbi:MAG: WXG100 family type VII secretion target [Microbacterium sp.]
MDGRIIAVEHDSLDATCRAIARHIEKIDAELDRLEAAADVLSTQWTGEAQAAYRAAQAKWHQGYREMTVIAHALTTIAHRGNSRFREQDLRDAGAWAH